METSTVEQFLPLAEAAQRWVAYQFKLQYADAADIVQHVLASLCRPLPYVVDNPKAFLFKACARKAMQLREKNDRWRFQPLDPDEHTAPPFRPPDPVKAVESNNPRLSKLRSTHREVVEMLYEGYKPAEIARRLNLTIEAFRCRLRAMRLSLPQAA